MKAGQTFRCLFWALLYCVLYLFTSEATEEDLADFDFADLKEIDWNYDSDQINEQLRAENVGQKGTSAKPQKHNSAAHTSITFDDFEEENQVRPFDWRENVLRTALSKALTNAALRQKFVEVMPILRVLSSQQRLALSALISAQINAKGGQQLKLEQVRMMFGDDKQLLLPIVYDIANLVRSSAHKYLQFGDYATLPSPVMAKLQQQQQTPIERRMDTLTSAELADNDMDKDVGNIVVSAHAASDANDEDSLEDFFADMPADVLDPQRINEGLQDVAIQPSATSAHADANSSKVAGEKKDTNVQSTINLTNNTQLNEPAGKDVLSAAAVAPKRQKRAANNEFVHKLIRSVPLSISEDDVHRAIAGMTVQLNTTNFVVPKDTTADTQLTIANAASNTPTVATHVATSELPPTQSYQEIEDLAFASLNGTELELTDATVAPLEARIEGEPLPSPEELIAGPRYRVSGNKIYGGGGRLKHVAVKRKRVQAPRTRSKVPPPSRSGGGGKGDAVLLKKCERFTASMCIRTEDYPLDQIMGSIRRHKNAMTALLADYHDKATGLDFIDDFDDFSFNRRGDESTGGGMCHSVVRYARPQKARSASGEWKYIVNTGQHTQTLRLEKCTAPQDSCSYLAHSYRSHCAQVYNYHRLLSWDKARGLHVDIFKVPSCCSCQVDGYRQQFPPLAALKPKGTSPAFTSDTYSTINEELDYNDEEDDDDLNFQYSNGYNSKHHKHDIGYDDNELFLASQKVRTTLHAPNPTLGSYLSPPGGEEEEYEKGYAFTHTQKQTPHQQQQHSHSQLAYAQQPSMTSSTPPGSSAKNLLRDLARRRPYKSLSAANAYNEARVDLDLAQSEMHPDNEVKFAGSTHANANKRLPHKRQRTYSVPHTASVSSSAAATNAVAVAAATVAADVAAGAGATTATVAATSPTAMVAATRGGIVGSRSGAATNAHQASAASPGRHRHHQPTQQQASAGADSSSTAQGNNQIGGSNFRSKPRFRSPIATAAAATSTSTESSYRQWTVHQQQTTLTAQPPHNPLYKLNSIYNTPHNRNNTPTQVTATTATDAANVALMPKRINYSYHPIIDFFENHRYSTVETPAQQQQQHQRQQLEEYSGGGGGSGDVGQLYPHKIPKAQVYDMMQSRDRRIGVGAGASVGAGVNVGMGMGMGMVEGVGSVVGGSVHSDNVVAHDFHMNDNAWHPVIVE